MAHVVCDEPPLDGNKKKIIYCFSETIARIMGFRSGFWNQSHDNNAQILYPLDPEEERALVIFYRVVEKKISNPGNFHKATARQIQSIWKAILYAEYTEIKNQFPSKDHYPILPHVIGQINQVDFSHSEAGGVAQRILEICRNNDTWGFHFGKHTSATRWEDRQDGLKCLEDEQYIEITHKGISILEKFVMACWRAWMQNFTG